MAVKITSVEPGSPARRARIHKGDTLISINGNPITDVLDYQFYTTDEHLEILLCDEEKKVRTVLVEKDEYDDLGLQFETYLMDKQMGCRNACIFCFVDQMPPGMRKSLYFKDDDTRMSFLFGNYTTLTNLKEGDIRRIIKMHISPINISVHTMNPELRVQMMKNPFAGKALDFIRMLTEGGIRVNTQIVLCPGYNDGEELEYSLQELAKLGPNVQSIAVVPVGLTKYREGLTTLRGFFPQEAKEVLQTMERWGDYFLKEYGARTAYASDEFYILAEQPFPDYDFYEDFSQLENGVGMMTLLQHDFALALQEALAQGVQPAARDRHRRAGLPDDVRLCPAGAAAFPTGSGTGQKDYQRLFRAHHHCGGPDYGAGPDCAAERRDRRTAAADPSQHAAARTGQIPGRCDPAAGGGGSGRAGGAGGKRRLRAAGRHAGNVTEKFDLGK